MWDKGRIAILIFSLKPIFTVLYANKKQICTNSDIPHSDG